MGARRVVVTGAAGSIGRVVVRGLSERWDLVATDRRGAAVRLDVTDPEACASAFRDAAAVVHLAAVPDPDATFAELLAPNVVGAWTVAAAARDAGVPRLVLASSLQAVSGYPEGHQVQESDPPRPANLYGATKAWAEALGWWVASTSDTSVVALRIGHFAETPPDEAASARDVSAWLSHGDAVELVRAAVEADVTRMVVAAGVSANRFRHADLRMAQSRLGYSPRDDAWDR